MEPPLQRLTTLTAEIQEAVRRVRMQLIGEAWRKLPGIVRGLAQHLGKRIELVTVGADTEIDRQALDLIRDPLIHVVRNCADHGLESPDERRRAGKPETGCISVSACRKADHVLVEIADDGRGLDADRIRHTALQSGLATAAELAQIPEVRLNRFIFRAGFSTADAVTSVSGRGVGLDVVRANVRMVGGTVDVRSRPGRGTTFLISIPISTAAPPLTSYPAVPV